MGIIRDHLGNHFTSETKMCEYHGIDNSTFRSRIRRGMSLEEALATPIKTFEYTDHMGNIYDSETEMCKFYGIRRSTYRKRREAGWSVQEALSQKVKTNRIPCMDHLGQEYESFSCMCRHWHIGRDTFANRIKNGWTLEATLTTPVRENILSEDHEGNVFESESSMCSFWNVDRATYKQRKDILEWTLEEALTGIRKKAGTVKDGYGNFFSSEKEMCEYYEVSLSAFAHRKANGMTVEQALTYEIPKCYDHNGNEYNSVQEMCIHWGIKRSTYDYRISLGWTLEESLTIPARYSLGEARVMKCLDELGVSYIHDMSIKSIFTKLNIGCSYDAFVAEYQRELNQKHVSIGKKKIEKMRFDFTIIRDKNIFAFIEFDGEQHFVFVHLFFKTLNKFMQRNSMDFVKNSYATFLGVPLLRIRYDQVEMTKLRYMIDDLLSNPQKYVKVHNTFLSNEEYWEPFTNYCSSIGLPINVFI